MMTKEDGSYALLMMTMGDEGGGLWGEFSMVGIAPDRSFGRERPLGRQIFM
jgi:hypothetical protein